MSKQRKSNWQQPNTFYREREETPGNDECDIGNLGHARLSNTLSIRSYGLRRSGPALSGHAPPRP
jgi:hypothetical protein